MKGEAIRFLRSNTHAPTFTNIICIFKKHLLHRKYPKHFIDRILNRITHDLRPNYIPTLNPSPNPSPIPSPSPRPHYSLLSTLCSPHFTPHQTLATHFRRSHSLYPLPFPTSGLLPGKPHPLLQLGESSPPRTLTPSIQGCPHYHQHHCITHY